MNSLRFSLAFALTATALSPLIAQAQTVEFAYPVSVPITVDGQSGALDLALYLPLAPTVSETLADGTKHTSFTSLNTDHEPFSSWQISKLVNGSLVQVAPGYGPAQPYQVDTYLTPSGSSSLVFDWNYQVECHGGCTTFGLLHFDLASAGGGLFANTLQNSVFAISGDVHGSGFERIVRTPNFGPDGPVVQLTEFTVGNVPEPEGLALMAAGLMALGLVSGKAKSKNTHLTP